MQATKEKRCKVQSLHLTDPLCGKRVGALELMSPSGLRLLSIPGRALDIYSLAFGRDEISYTNRMAGLCADHFAEDGTQGFVRNFFAGFLTTCGLIQSGRPCMEGGRRFGLHGRISNTACPSFEMGMEGHDIWIAGDVDEVHPEGEHMRLRRTLRLSAETAQLDIDDQVTNMGGRETPYMVMYHINFGRPFLSERLKISADFRSIEDRDTGAAATMDEATRIEREGYAQGERVFYTQIDPAQGVRLESPDSGIAAKLDVAGHGLEWLGIWKSYDKGQYALGIEPCNCPGIGRVQARERGLLPMLLPGETRSNHIRLSLARQGLNLDI